MDPFDEHIIRVLRDSKPRDFHKLLDEAGFSHNTLRLHLNTSMDKGLITRERVVDAGRSRIDARLRTAPKFRKTNKNHLQPNN